MKYIVCMPNQTLAVFDEAGREFSAWDFDPDSETEIDEMHDRLFPEIGRRLFEAELAFAKQELSPLADTQPGASKFVNRWDRALSKLVLDYGTAHALHVLSDMGFRGYVLPDWLLEAWEKQEKAFQAEDKLRLSYLNRPNPIVDSTKDEDVWKQI